MLYANSAVVIIRISISLLIKYSLLRYLYYATWQFRGLYLRASFPCRIILLVWSIRGLCWQLENLDIFFRMPFLDVFSSTLEFILIYTEVNVFIFCLKDKYVKQNI